VAAKEACPSRARSRRLGVPPQSSLSAGGGVGNFHWLRHTAGSLMAVAGLDPAVASEWMGHTDGGALFLSTYRHLYEGEKRVQARRLEDHVRASLDIEGTSSPGSREKRLNQAVSEDGRTWDRTRDLPRVKRALSR